MPPLKAMPTLLLIDDEPIIHDFIKIAIQEMGIRLLAATSAKEGLAAFSSEKPDVVVLDVGLPDLSGLETFRRLQQIDDRVPVIFITGAGTTATAIEAMSLGAFDYVLKPLEFSSLRELIHRAVEVARLMRVPAIDCRSQATNRRLPIASWGAARPCMPFTSRSAELLPRMSPF